MTSPRGQNSLDHYSYCLPLMAAMLLSLGPANPARAGVAGAPVAGTAIHPVYEQARQAVFLVETETWRGTGFLVDTSGLILTSFFAATSKHHLAVVIAPGKKVPAVIVRQQRFRWVAVIKVNPEAVAGLRPLALAGRDGGGASSGEEVSPAEGDRLFGLFASLGGEPELSRGVIDRVRSGSIRSNLPVRSFFTGGPVLDVEGRVLGMNPRLFGWRKTRTHILRIHKVEGLLANARARPVENPPFVLLPTAPSVLYPPDALKGLNAARFALSAYQARAGPFVVEFLTPPILEALRAGGNPPVSRGADACWRAKGEIDRWRPDYYSASPVVSIQVIPEIRRRVGTYIGVTAYWVFYPVILLVALFGNNGDILIDPPNVSSHFDPPIEEIQLLRGGKEVLPIYPGRTCFGTWAKMEINLCPPASGRKKKRRVKGCYGLFTYDAREFAPGEAMELRIHRKGRRSDPDVVTLRPDLIGRIWSDFKPYFEIIGGSGEEGLGSPDPEEVP